MRWESQVPDAQPIAKLQVSVSDVSADEGHVDSLMDKVAERMSATKKTKDKKPQ
jgi:hypothetical protein